jgi:hypothetical protein
VAALLRALSEVASQEVPLQPEAPAEADAAKIGIDA